MLLSDYDIRVSNVLAYLLVIFKFEKNVLSSGVVDVQKNLDKTIAGHYE